MNPIFNKHFVPLTKGDSREAAGGQGLSHFYLGNMCADGFHVDRVQRLTGGHE